MGTKLPRKLEQNLPDRWGRTLLNRREQILAADDYNAGLWEHFCHVLTKQAGIKSASTKVIATSDHYSELHRYERKSTGTLSTCCFTYLQIR